MQLTITDSEGKPLDAKIEVEGDAIIVHSRSGAGTNARNPDYRPALEAILMRLAAIGAKPAFYLDSRPVAHLPLERRRIATPAELTGSPEEKFQHLVRAMNAGTDSHGAWRRIRLIVPGQTQTELADAIASLPSTSPTRLPAAQLRQVTAKHVEKAVADIASGKVATNFSMSRDYDLMVAGGIRLAPKQVFGRALELALGIEAFPEHFSAGLGTPCFQALEAAGYAIVPKPEASIALANRERSTASIDEDQPSSMFPDEDRKFVEGSAKRANHLLRERNRALVAEFKTAFRAKHGHFHCENCKNDWRDQYGEAIAEACFEAHHAVTQVADMLEDHQTTIADLQLLCANCHRAEHRRMRLKK
ncbi:HNH endonuclease [Aurantiacibacter zhengii]|uniref:HNH domain-containing protein n=1 Tax=Aurantiacibacter zhengii TaxID=2307003 RepID=A0A418NSQ0_9SPHN|nr:HNH endonuclease [Aurantiacibacter zhengii]RIV85955.1 hypothetical protein D2V07_11695 [Aurantiacibacter zhengii]